MFHAHGQCRQVHHPQLPLDRLLEGELICSGGEDDDRSLMTAEEISKLPDFLRELVESGRQLRAERDWDNDREFGGQQIQLWAVDSSGTWRNPL